jgi:hypothetical protein
MVQRMSVDIIIIIITEVGLGGSEIKIEQK